MGSADAAAALSPDEEQEALEPTPEQRQLMCYLREQVPLRLSPTTLQEAANFSRCAVVSSSGALKAHKRGSEIDAHTAVFRFNNAPTEGFEEFVGRKDTVRLLGEKGFDRLGRRVRDGTLYVWIDVGEGPMADELKGHGYLLEKDGFEQMAKVMKDLFAGRWWNLGLAGQSFQPTTGALGVLLALSLCNVTDAYDMSPSEASKEAPYHYYGRHSKGDLKADDNSWHKTFEAERELWARLSVTPRDVVFKTGRATIPGLHTISCDGAGDGVAKPQRIAFLAMALGGWTALRKAATQGPVVLFGSLFLAITLTAGFLLSLWWQRGLLSHMWRGLRSPSSAPGAVALIVYLLMLVSLDLLIKHEAELGHGHYATSPLVVVPLVEFGKLLTSLVLYGAGGCFGRFFGRRSGEAEQPAAAALLTGAGAGSPWRGAAEVAKLMLPVALIYNANNLLNFVVLAHVRLDAYAVWRNLSILFNAVIWVWALQRHIEVHRWVAVGACLLGSCFNTLGADGRIIVDVALSGVLLSALLSSVASVFNERVIKSKEAASLGIDQVNLLLYSETLSLMSLGLVLYGLARGFPSLGDVRQTLAGITPGAWKIIGMQVAMGLSVSRVLKHADAVAKTVVGSLRDVAIVFIAPHIVTATRFDTIAVGSACLVGLAGMIYAVPAPVVDAGHKQQQSPFQQQGKDENETQVSLAGGRWPPPPVWLMASGRRCNGNSPGAVTKLKAEK